MIFLAFLALAVGVTYVAVGYRIDAPGLFHAGEGATLIAVIWVLIALGDLWLRVRDDD